MAQPLQLAVTAHQAQLMAQQEDLAAVLEQEKPLALEPLVKEMQAVLLAQMLTVQVAVARELLELQPRERLALVETLVMAVLVLILIQIMQLQHQQV